MDHFDDEVADERDFGAKFVGEPTKSARSTEKPASGFAQVFGGFVVGDREVGVVCFDQFDGFTDGVVRAR